MSFNYYNQYQQTVPQTNYSVQQPTYMPQQYVQPYQQMFQPQQQAAKQTNIEYVNGVAGAKALMLMPNSTHLVLDSDGAFFYIKTTDMEGKPMLKRFKYEEVDENGISVVQRSQETARATPEYATVQEMKDSLQRLEEYFTTELDKIRQIKSSAEGKK